MLILTHRHSYEDIKLWEQYREADKVYYSEKLRKKEIIAIEWIKEFSCNNDCYAGVSWGKDSTTVAHLIYRSKINTPLVHLYCVPSHNPYCDSVRDAYLSNYKSNYHEIVVNYGDVYSQNLPDHLQDKITDRLFYSGFAEAVKRFGKKHISGIRADESAGRKFRSIKFGIKSKNTLAPLTYWSAQDVFSYLAHYNLPVHPNYAMLGCGRWDRNKIRVAEIGDISGTGFGRTEWEKEYYQDQLNMIRRKERGVD